MIPVDTRNSRLGIDSRTSSSWNMSSSSSSSPPLRRRCSGTGVRSSTGTTVFAGVTGGSVSISDIATAGCCLSDSSDGSATVLDASTFAEGCV